MAGADPFLADYLTVDGGGACWLPDRGGISEWKTVLRNRNGG